MFPASRSELYDPAKEYGRYTIHGGEVNNDNAKELLRQQLPDWPEWYVNSVNCKVNKKLSMLIKS